MEFWEALLSLYEFKGLAGDMKYVCLVCGHKVNYEYAIKRHIDNKHSDKLYELSGRAHGWDSID